MTWAPDSTAVAFSLDTPLVFRDSDVYVFEVGTGTLENLTQDDPNGTSADEPAIGDDGPEVPVDLYPAWSPDSQELVFARTAWGGEGDYETSLKTIPRSGGDPEVLFPVTSNRSLSIASPMIWQEDGTIFLSIWPGELNDAQNSIWRLSGESDMEHVLPGAADDDVPLPSLADITSDGQRVSIAAQTSLSGEVPEPGTTYFHLALEEGEVQPWEELLGLETDLAAALGGDSAGIFVAPPVFSADDRSVAYMTRTADDMVHVSVLDAAGTTHDVFSSAPTERSAADALGEPRLEWSENNRLLVISEAGTVLLTFHQ